MTPKTLFATDTSSVSTSYGLLVMRLAGLSLFFKHGWEKLSGYSTMVQLSPEGGLRGNRHRRGSPGSDRGERQVNNE
jgi:uncharacterized membrane protein YphA (DoxX/SURF4 family)